MLYSSEIESRFRNPAYSGPASQGAQTLTGRATTSGSSAVLQLNLQLADKYIQRATFQALGCPSCIAAGDWACEWLTGRELHEITQLSAAMIEAALELAPAKRHVALLVEDALAEITAGNSHQTKLS